MALLKPSISLAARFAAPTYASPDSLSYIPRALFRTTLSFASRIALFLAAFIWSAFILPPACIVLPNCIVCSATPGNILCNLIASSLVTLPVDIMSLIAFCCSTGKLVM